MKYIQTDFNSKTVVITGGAGFIGSNLAFYFQENYPKAKIIVFDKYRSEEKSIKYIRSGINRRTAKKFPKRVCE